MSWPTLQRLNDEAFGPLQAKAGISRGEHVRELTPHQLAAYVLGRLNYQVENGGFLQWHDNGYSEYAGDVAWAIRKVGGERAEEVEAIFSQALVCLTDFDCVDVDDLDGDEYDAVCEPLNSLDLRFYAVNKAWLDDVEAYFAEATS